MSWIRSRLAVRSDSYRHRFAPMWNLAQFELQGQKTVRIAVKALLFFSETWEPPQFWEKKTLSEWKGHSRSNSRNSGVFSEQFSEWHSRPSLCENPILGATLGAILGIGWTPNFSPNSRSVFFKIGVLPARQTFSLLRTVFLLGDSIC